MDPNIANIPESQLIERMRAGDKDAYRYLVETYERKIYNLSLRILGNREDAEDVLQETFLQIFNGIHKFRTESRLSTWIYRIATNASLMKLRSRPKVNLVSLDDDGRGAYESDAYRLADWGKDPDQMLLDSELRERMQHAIERLPELYRAAFLLKDVERLSASEVAEVLNISEEAVYSRVKRARVYLRDELSDYVGKSGGKKARVNHGM